MTYGINHLLVIPPAITSKRAKRRNRWRGKRKAMQYHYYMQNGTPYIVSMHEMSVAEVNQELREINKQVWKYSDLFKLLEGFKLKHTQLADGRDDFTWSVEG